MSSPGIRYVNLARVLRNALPDAVVTLASPTVPPEERLPDVPLVFYDPRSALRLARRHDVVVAMSFPLSIAMAAPLLNRPVLVLDFFSQFYVEWMEMGRDIDVPARRDAWTRARNVYANLQLLIADHVLCANERQRDSYIGVLGALGRLTPALYDKDPSLRGLIDVAPHGVRPEPPPLHVSPAGLRPWLRPGDRLFLWLGGILSWYDPVTLLRALARVRETHPEAKLLFLGSNYPGGSELGKGLRYHEAVAEAQRLGLLNDGVYFEDEWQPHESIVSVLAAATAGVTTYFDTAETHFAHRTRFLDYIWAGLPIISTSGDLLANETVADGRGATAEAGDESAITSGLLQLLEEPATEQAYREAAAAAAQRMTWENAFETFAQWLQAHPSANTIEEPRARRRFDIVRATAAYVISRLRERASR